MSVVYGHGIRAVGKVRVLNTTRRGWKIQAPLHWNQHWLSVEVHSTHNRAALYSAPLAIPHPIAGDDVLSNARSVVSHALKPASPIRLVKGITLLP